DAPVRTARLSSSFAQEAGGALTRKGTPRLDLLAAARAAYVQQKADQNDSDVLRFDSGAHSIRRDGTHVKSIQGHAEDVWRRIYKRPVPEGDPLDHEGFHRLYRRMQASLRRTDLLEDRGAAIDDPNKKVRDQHGKRWALSDQLDQACGEPADPPSFVRCAGEAPSAEEESAEVGVWTRVERQVAREKDLHQEFTHAITASQLDGQRYTANARRWERRYAREGSERPRYRTIGQWRPEAIGQPKRHEQAVRVPWIVAEIDGRGEDGDKDRGASDRLAHRLLRRLKEFGVDLSGVMVSYSGNASIHVRIPDGAVGCPIYRNAREAKESLSRFFDRLCGQDEALRRAIDNACLRPGQLIRAIGSVHEATGRRTVGCAADTFLSKPASFLFSLSEPQFEYTPPESIPLPRRASFVPALSVLLDTPDTPRDSGPEKTNVSQSISPQEEGGESGLVIGRVKGGVREGEPWGPDVGRPCAVGRNWAALFVAHDVLRRTGGKESAWGKVWHWNRYNDPSLPENELRAVFEKACRYQRGEVP
ncbi:hypothetical protein, partial [Salinibacter ruber]|uniref:hypothetical protein n=2 Tax=Salinibacter ruber TaxID=146919 RepID=UPI0021677657